MQLIIFQILQSHFSEFYNRINLFSIRIFAQVCQFGSTRINSIIITYDDDGTI